MAFAGLVLSTVMVGWASARFDHNLIVYAANLASFGVLWVVKFFVLEHLMWGPATEAADAVEVGSNAGIAMPAIATTGMKTASIEANRAA
jgi:hypothetical protein